MVPEDVGELACKLSPSDLRELAIFDVDPFSALKAGYETGCFAGCLDGKIEAAFGVNQEVVPAAIWFLGSELARSRPREFIVMGRRWVEMLTANLRVANVVPEMNKTTIRWLKSLDFEFSDDVYNVNGYAIRRFHRGPLTTSLPH